MGAHVWAFGYLRDVLLPHGPSLGVDARLVRRLPRLPVLHGRPVPRDGGAQRRARRRRRASFPAWRRSASRPSGRCAGRLRPVVVGARLPWEPWLSSVASGAATPPGSASCVCVGAVGAAVVVGRVVSGAPAMVVRAPPPSWSHSPASRCRTARRSSSSRSPAWSPCRCRPTCSVASPACRTRRPRCSRSAALGFLFDKNFTIYGGNIASTMAGEFAFSISLALAIVYLGVSCTVCGRHAPGHRRGAARPRRPVPPDPGVLRARAPPPCCWSCTSSGETATDGPTGRRARLRRSGRVAAVVIAGATTVTVGFATVGPVVVVVGDGAARDRRPVVDPPRPRRHRPRCAEPASRARCARPLGLARTWWLACVGARRRAAGCLVGAAVLRPHDVPQRHGVGEDRRPPRRHRDLDWFLDDGRTLARSVRPAGRRRAGARRRRAVDRVPEPHRIGPGARRPRPRRRVRLRAAGSAVERTPAAVLVPGPLLARRRRCRRGRPGPRPGLRGRDPSVRCARSPGCRRRSACCCWPASSAPSSTTCPAAVRTPTAATGCWHRWGSPASSPTTCPMRSASTSRAATSSPTGRGGTTAGTSARTPTPSTGRIVSTMEDVGRDRGLRHVVVGVQPRPQRLRHPDGADAAARTGPTGASARWRASTSRRRPPRRSTSSCSPSCRPPRRGPSATCPYRELDIDAGVEHLQLMGVRYYMARSAEADRRGQHPSRPHRGRRLGSLGRLRGRRRPDGRIAVVRARGHHGRRSPARAGCARPRSTTAVPGPALDWFQDPSQWDVALAVDRARRLAARRSR